MSSTSFTRAIAYCQQALQSCEYALAWLQKAGVSAPLYLATINEISAAVVVIQAMVDNLVNILENQEAGNVISPIATVINVDLTSAAPVNLYVVPAGKTLYCLGMQLRCTQRTAPNNDGAWILQALVGGFQILGEQVTLPGVVGNATNFWLPSGQQNQLIAAGNTVQFAPAFGPDSGAGVMGAVDLFGYLL